MYLCLTVLPEVDDVDVSVGGNKDAPWAAGVGAGPSKRVDKGLLVDMQQD